VLLADLAAGRHGVVSHAELVAMGIRGSAVTRRVRSGRLHRHYRGVYSVGHHRLTPEGRLMAAVLASGPGAVVSHRDAAALLGIWDIRHARIDITTDRRTRKAQPSILLHRVRHLPDDECTEIRGIPVTTVARTAVDLADLVGRPRLARILREADYRGVLDLEACDKAIARAHGRRRVSLLVDALEAHRPGIIVRSELEHRFLELCREHGLPVPEMNVRKTISGRRYELDCLWQAEGVVVELDGAAAHSSAYAFEADRARDSALSAAGLIPLRYTWRRLERDERSVVAELAAVLNA
jgi:predicted transcriptional regulator of viral defense system